MTTRLDTKCKQRIATISYRYLFLFAIVFGGSFLIISIIYGTDFRILAHNFLLVPNTTQDHQLNDTRIFTIQTEGCTISALNSFDENMKKVLRYPSRVKPCLYNNSSLLNNNNTHIWIVKDNIFYYNVSEFGNFNCCYKSFRRPNMISDINSKLIDRRVHYESCIYFFDYIEALDEFVRVTCSYQNMEIYEQFFLFAPKKELMLNNIYFSNNVDISLEDNQTDYNVLIMGIDAVSRMNFHRTMPKTLTYLKKLHAIELLGYNKVGDNTFPNVIPLLLGISEKDLRKTCLPKPYSSFDNCPFVWEWFKDKGYYTALGEDSAKLGTFNYFKVGFAGTPTDYYLYTFMHESEKRSGNNKDFNTYLCMGNKYFYSVLLDYITNLSKTLASDKLFGFFWEVSMSHDYLNYPMLMDKSYEKFLKTLYTSGYLEKTVLILLSDHGMRWGHFRNTKQGRLEERLPFVYILFPHKFRKQYKVAYKNIRNNAKKLTTPFDLHEMLMDLVNMKNLRDAKLYKRKDEPYTINRGISLFLPIPGNRTCKTADIDEHWCTCNKGKKLQAKDGDVSEATNDLISHLNGLLRGRPQCATLALAEIIDATETEISNADKTEKSFREMTLVARVSPGDAIFEATLRRDDNWSVSGSVSRLNLYGNQSYCVNDYWLKLYCYCN